MTSNCYVIDTSSLVELNKHNPLDVFPSMWEKLESLIAAGQLVAPKEVLYEIRQKDDELALWAKNQIGMFKEPTPAQITYVRSILKEYPSILKIDRKYDADAWVIALALEMSNNPQRTLVAVKRIVVTEERLRGDRVRIPYICLKRSIEAIDIISMFRAEGWKF